MTPPKMAAWNLALRFGLEIAAFTGLTMAAWTLTPGGVRWFAVIAAPVVAATIWGMFNVLDDPSRSGQAPVEVSGPTRLVIELAILGGGAAAYFVIQQPLTGAIVATLIVLQYGGSWHRIDWLMSTSSPSHPYDHHLAQPDPPGA
ncbi:MAG: YrdB family protein [Acidimicrobiales bacterium]